MRKFLCVVVLLCIAAAGFAEAGQYRVAPPSNMRKRPPPPGRRESRLEIVNRDDRGYAIDVDYRRNRLELQHRASGNMYVPANSSVVLTFDDDDDWHILGDYESLDIEIRAGRTTTLRLETKMNRNQVGLFATVNDGRRQYSKQLFKYADRPGRPGRPGMGHKPPPPPKPISRPPLAQPYPSYPSYPSHPSQPPYHGRPGYSSNPSVGDVVGKAIDSLIGNDQPHRRN